MEFDQIGEILANIRIKPEAKLTRKRTVSLPNMCSAKRQSDSYLSDFVLKNSVNFTEIDLLNEAD